MTLVTHQTAPQIGKNNNQQNKQDRNKTNGKKQNTLQYRDRNKPTKTFHHQTQHIETCQSTTTTLHNLETTLCHLSPNHSTTWAIMLGGCICIVVVLHAVLAKSCGFQWASTVTCFLPRSQVWNKNLGIENHESWKVYFLLSLKISASW